MNSNTAFMSLAQEWPLLEPAMDPNSARTKHVRLPASKTYPAGQVLAPVLATPGLWAAPDPGGASIANPTTAPTFGTAAAGVVPAGVYQLGYTYVGASGETMLSSLGSRTVGASENLPVNAIAALPAGVTAVNWYMSEGPGSLDMKFIVQKPTNAAFIITAVPSVVAVGPPAANTALATATTTGPRRMLLQYPCATNAAGEVSIGAVVYENDTKYESVPAYWKGCFKVSDLTGIASAAQLGELGHLVHGAAFDEAGAIIELW